VGSAASEGAFSEPDQVPERRQNSSSAGASGLFSYSSASRSNVRISLERLTIVDWG
jgi:hypothetical protein